MLSLLQSNEHLVASSDNYSFLNKNNNNTIQVSIDYNTCLQSNYIAYQNVRYSNKWFFAFIDSIRYVSDKTTEISFTIDDWSTWFGYWASRKCYVLREHVVNDSIGLHTIPENLEHGEYIIGAAGEIETELDSTYIIIACSEVPSNTPHLPPSQVYGGVFSGLYYLAFEDSVSAKKFILAYDEGKASAINNVFMIPKKLCVPINWYTASLASQENITFGIIGNTLGGIIIRDDITLNMLTSLNGYTPKNNKVLCYPYQALSITNNAGSNVEYRYEDFINNVANFNLAGVLCPSASLKLYPTNNKKYQSSEYIRAGYNFGIIANKYPICSWDSDSYTNWLTQQAINIPTQYVNLGVNAVKSAIDKDLGGTLNTFNQLSNMMSEKYQHDLQPVQAFGNLNGGDVNFAMSQAGFNYYKMCIKSEYAKIIDDYFTRFGYQVNSLKVPNLDNRKVFNYVKIGASEEIGYSSTSFSVNNSSMHMINSICRNGTTIWHNHKNIGNYDLDNSNK